MRIVAASLAALLLLAVVVRAEEAKPIDASDKAALDAQMDKDVTVVGTVKTAQWSKSGKVMNVDFQNSTLILAVFEKSKEAVNKANDGDAAAKWTGAKVTVKGKLAKYGGKAKEYLDRPQIIISKPEQVKVEAPAKAE